MLMIRDITGGASRRKWSERIVPVAEPVPVYGSVEQYDPVLRSHCRMEGLLIFPSLPTGDLEDSPAR